MNIFVEKAPPVVLIVEDDEFIQMVLQRGFAKNQVQTYSALNGAKALDILNTNNDITHIVLDLNMPVMDGYSLIAHMNKEERFKDLHIAVTSCNNISAFTEYVKIRNINTDLVKSYFLKPVEFNELFQSISAVA